MDVVPEDAEYSEIFTQNVRNRTASLNSTSLASTASFQNTRTLRLRSSVASMRGITPEAEPAEIVSPVPRRHLSHTSESLSWLKAGAFSDVDSQARCISPLSAASSTPSLFPPSSSRQLSFSVLLEQEKRARVAALRRTQSEDTMDQGAVRRCVRWMHKHNMKGWVVPCAIAASTYVKWCIGLGSYSGYGTPPMFGDYEAQRHWMELTIHLPVQQWYRYDLQYWGLDYPPLTAYVSWICGKIGSWIEPSWFGLDTSRGLETPGNKLFMRASVITLDALIYVPALYAFTRIWHATRSSRTQHAALITLLFHPALLLIDFGHFQYNSVMLGFMLLAINAFAVGFDLLGAVLFVLSLGFKQMSLYYAPAIGAYLLGKCIFLGSKKGLKLFTRLALVTTFSFVILFAPFLPPFSPMSTLAASISRIFPFSRGLFEDKVANFWCFTNVTVLKWRRLFDGKESLLIKGSAVLTTLGFFPAVAGLLWGCYKTQSSPSTPTLPLLPYALLTTSMSFFLFSFQVHEKSILLPLLPLTLLLSGASPSEEVFAWGTLGNTVGVFSMWPLLKKDGLGIQYVAMLLFWCRLIGYSPFRVQFNSFVHLFSTVVNMSMILLHLLEMVVTPPARYPDLFPVLNILVSTPVFGLIWLWSIKRGIQVSWAIAGLPRSRTEGKIKLAKDGAHDSDNEPASTTVRRPEVEGVRRDAGMRAVSLGYASGRAVLYAGEDWGTRGGERWRGCRGELGAWRWKGLQANDDGVVF
ncbi:glycosyltransferase family 57 protein [Boletus reticuloceps]|uniref:Alpha-1,3-glucosyltransferase n=1 Tax=Boletus reticuloceps TaxID=495285 RepID=A0A8I2YX99_9AGAM|nr:glycosyltransferase family 57 protein [Boletus reticuloceps]